MGKINIYLKCVFIFFNVLFGIIGCLMIYLAVKLTIISRELSEFGLPGTGWFWVIAISIFGISSLGIFAACTEKSLFLKIFAGFMVTEMIIMFIFGTVVVVARNKVKNDYQRGAKKMVQVFTNNTIARVALGTFQILGSCCGVVSAEDWGSDIPSSCECDYPDEPSSRSKCKPKPPESSGPSQIYAKSCSDTIFSYIDFLIKMAMGILFGFAVLALMGLLISLLMNHQVNRRDNAGAAFIAMKGY